MLFNKTKRGKWIESEKRTVVLHGWGLKDSWCAFAIKKVDMWGEEE